MARVNVYLPDELAEASRAAGLNVSRIAQDALRAELDSVATTAWLADLRALAPTRVSHEAAINALHAARDELDGG